MKKKLLIALQCLLLSYSAVHAQTGNIDPAKAQAEADKTKTGANQDVLANYLQVAANNITSTDKNVQLKINWFAFDGMDSVKKYNDVNYLNTRWLRNGNFIANGGLDANSKFNSVGAGFTYNIWNKRDTAFANYHNSYASAMASIKTIKKAVRLKYLPGVTTSVGTRITAIITHLIASYSPTEHLTDSILQSFKNYKVVDGQDTVVILTVQNDLNNAVATHNTNYQQLWHDVTIFLIPHIADKLFTDAINLYTDSQGKQVPAYDNYISEKLFKMIIAEINAGIKSDHYLQTNYKATDINDFYSKVAQQYKNAVEYVARQPLLTIGGYGTHGTGDALSSYVVQVQFLYGLSKLGSEKSTELTITINDTTTSTDPTGKIRNMGRNFLAMQGGINFVLAKQKKASVMELNIGVEDDQVVKGIAVSEKWNSFLFNSYFRVRLPNTPWLKLNIKYDPKNHNVLGLLNFTYNIDKS